MSAPAAGSTPSTSPPTPARSPQAHSSRQNSAAPAGDGPSATPAASEHPPAPPASTHSAAAAAPRSATPAATPHSPDTGFPVPATDSPPLGGTPRTTFPAPAPESPSTSHRTQYGAASAAIHAPPPASAPTVRGSADRASNRTEPALPPSSILSVALQHLRFPANHAPAAATPSPPAATRHRARPPPPQTHCAIPHAAPRSRPDSASALLYPVLPAAAAPPVCDSWRSLFPSAPETTAAAAQTTTASAPTAKSASSAAAHASLLLLLPSPLLPTVPASAAQTASSPAVPLPGLSKCALADARLVMSAHPTRRNDPAALLAPLPATPAKDLPDSSLSRLVAVHSCVGHRRLPPAQAALCDPASRWASAAVFPMQRRLPAPCTPAAVPPGMYAALQPLPPHSPPHTPPGASPLSHPPAPPPQLPAPPHVRPVAPQSPPTQSGIPGSSPDSHSVPETQCSQPPDNGPGLPSCTSAHPQPP